MMVDILVVDLPSGYKAMLGRPTLSVVKVVPSTFHLKMKFPMSKGVREVCGNQIATQSYYMASLKEN